MWFGKKKNKRSEGLKTTRASSTKHARRHRKPMPPAAITIGLLFVVVTTLAIIARGQIMPWRLDQRPEQDIRARVAFAEPDEQATKRAKELARESTPNYFTLNVNFLEQIAQDFTAFHNNIRAAGDYASLSEAYRKPPWGIDEAAFQKLKTSVGTISPEQLQSRLAKLRASLVALDVIDQIPEAYQKSVSVRLVDPAGNTSRQPGRWQLVGNRQQVGRLFVRAVAFPGPFGETVKKYLIDHKQAIWQFDETETERQRQSSYASQPGEYIEYLPGDKLIEQNRKIGERELSRLKLEHRKFLESRPLRWKVLSYAGTLTLVGLITLVLGVYCVKFEFRAIHNWTRSMALALTLLMMIIIILALGLTGWKNHYTAVFAVVLVGSVMTIAYNQRFALTVTVALTCLLLIGLQGDVSLLLTLFAGGITAVLTLDEVRRRSKLIEVAGASAMISIAVVWASQLISHQQPIDIFWNAANAGGAALLAGVIVQVALPVIEKLFQIATSMTLLEWCDASKPLLRRLALEAPGTFNHCLLLGSMAESAAESIGANGLLARVGAYYHDIGKITKREYYIENQPNLEMTRHKGLSPAISLLIIIGHVKDGLELAKEYALPRVLHQFIAEHHGTTLVEYFYHLASQQQTEAGEQPVSDVEFRYPGPKPRGKESAVLMLADGVEGATRALSEPTVGKIEATVHQIVKKKLEDGQFDQCDLTLRELHQIEESLTKSLWAIYHGRIKYPSQAKEAS